MKGFDLALWNQPFTTQEHEMSRTALFFCMTLLASVSHAATDAATDLVISTQPSDGGDLFLADAPMLRGEGEAEGAKNIAAKLIPQVRVGTTLVKGVNAYAKVGWELGKLISKGPGPGKYPGFKAAVIDPVVAKVRKK